MSKTLIDSPMVEAPGRVTPVAPLVVDLDGTLIKTDLLFETASSYLIEHPLGVFKLPFWLAEGKPVLKARLAEATRMDAAALPYNPELLEWLRDEKALGRHIVLATASNHVLAEQVAAHLGLFDEVLVTPTSDLKPRAKREALVQRFGERGFDYVGNDWRDIEVWKAAAQAHVVSRSQRLIGAARAHGNLGRILRDGKPSLAQGMFKAMRPHQWMKNLLIIVHSWPRTAMPT